MVTGGATKMFTNHGTSAPLAENVTKLAPMATVTTKFATMVQKSRSREVAMMFTWSVQKSAVGAEGAKRSLSEIRTFWAMLNSLAC